MDRSILSLEQTPPLAVPLIFMLTAPFFAASAALVVFVYPEAFESRWNPAMIAVTHLITLGFVTMVMIGALQQLFPVLIGAPLPSPVLVSRWVYCGFITGILALCSGILLIHPMLVGAGAFLLGLSIFILIGVLLRALVGSDATPMVTVGMKLAVLSFLGTIVLGLYLATSYIFPNVPLARNLTSLHVGWGFLGWIGILIITVSYQVVPMFQVTPKYPGRVVRWLSPCVFVCLLGVSAVSLVDLLPHQLSSFVSLGIELVLLVSFVFYAVVTIRLQRKRKRKVPDITMKFWQLGLVCLLLSCCLFLVEMSGVSPGFGFDIDIDLAVGVLMLVGFTMSLINGMLYKIIPFLIWLHLTNTIDMSLRWQLKIPNMKKIVPDVRAQRQFWVHSSALSLLLISLIESSFLPVAALLFLLSNLFLAYNLIGGVNVYRQVLNQVKAL